VKRLREERREAFTRAVRFENEQRVLGKDGRYRWFLVRYNPLLDEQGRVDRWYVAAFDIEDRKRAEWLRAAEMRTLQMITDGASLTDILNQVCTSIDLQIAPWFTTILLMDPDGKKLWPGAGPRVPQDWARAITPLPVAADTGLCGTAAFLKTRVIVPDVAGESIWREEYRGPALKNAIRAGWSQPIVTKDNQALGTFAVYSAEPRVPTDEDLALIEAAGPIALIAIERQRSQEALDKARSELAHAERVMSLGALTASIAHEINQPIAAAITSAGACLRWLNRDQPEVQRAREAAMRVEEDGKRASEIISHLKSFYKKDVAPRREMVSVNELVSDMQVLLRSEADRHSVVMRTELAADLPVVSADRVQLQQVLMNLMLNAMEAMSDRGGELSIRTRREGREVMVSVGDTGVGIPPDKMEEIFKAFFTTKAGGTGMGLAISSTIIESHGGGLWATVNPGGGATFHFTLSTEPEAHR